MKPKEKALKKASVPARNGLFYFFIISLMVFLPLVYIRSVQDPSLFPRMLLLSLILFAFAGALYGWSREYIPDVTLWKKPVIISFALYMVFVGISIAFSGNPAEGFTDLIKTGLTLLLILFSAKMFTLSDDWYSKFSKIALLAALCALAVGYFQMFQTLSSTGQVNTPDVRAWIYQVTGLMGHKNEYSSYLMLLLPFTLYLAIYKKGWLKIFSATVTGLMVIMLFLLTTRAVWVGIIVAASFIALLIWLKSKWFAIPGRLAKRVGLGVLVILILIIAGTLEGGKYTGNSYLEKLGSIVRPSVDNNHFRLKIWQITGKMAMDHPLTGVGAGNWQIEIPEYYHKINLKGKEINWLSPHNDYAWILSEKGIPGLLLYLSVIFSVFSMFFKIASGTALKQTKIQALLIMGGFTAYLTVAFFDFPYQRVDHQILFALMIGGLLALSSQRSSETKTTVHRNTVMIPVMIFLAVSLFYSIAVVNMQVHLKKMMALMNRSEWTPAENEVQKAKTPLKSLDAQGSPVEYYSGMIQDQQGNEKAALLSYQEALSEHPNHLAVLNNLGRSYFSMGYYGLAEHYYLKALQIVPGYLETRVNLATLYYQRNLPAKALEQLTAIKGVRKPDVVKKNTQVLRQMTGIEKDTTDNAQKLKKKALNKERKKRDRNQQGSGHDK